MLPKPIKAIIDLYVDKGCPTGSFLYAVLTNDLFEAAARADVVNKLCLADICMYIYNFTPSCCWGSRQEVEDWVKLHKEEPERAEVIAIADREGRTKYEYGL